MRSRLRRNGRSAHRGGCKAPEALTAGNARREAFGARMRQALFHLAGKKKDGWEDERIWHRMRKAHQLARQRQEVLASGEKRTENAGKTETSPPGRTEMREKGRPRWRMPQAGGARDRRAHGNFK